MTVSRLKVLTLFTFLTGGLTGCNGIDQGGEDTGAGGFATGGAEVGGFGGAGPETGGTTSTGGASTGGGSSCEGPARPPQAYLCAGQVTEREVLGFNWAVLQPTPYYYACGNDYYGTGGVGVGGTTSTGGAWAGGASAGGSAGAYYEEYPDEYYPNAGPTPEEPDYLGEGGAGPIYSTGGYGMGGEPYPGVGGAYPGTGGTAGGPMTPGGWCDGLTSGSIAGVSYAVGPCTQTQLRLPLRFQEPDGWYQLRVFAGAEACERGTLLYQTAGFGVEGAEVEIPVSFSEDMFVSIELTADEYWYSGEPAIELLPLPGGE